jgi:hypothetical protein
VYFDVKGRTRRGRESARKIFERGARSGQRNARLYRGVSAKTFESTRNISVIFQGIFVKFKMLIF